jgi:hypothetical protein
MRPRIGATARTTRSDGTVRPSRKGATITDAVPTIPSDAKVGLSMQEEVRELSEVDSRRVLERYPALLHEYRKRRAMTGTSGRLIVIDQRLVSEILGWLET